MSQGSLFSEIKGAEFSPCRTWRYALWRIWDDRLPAMAFCGLNPSTADETVNDRTINRCIGFARDWGYGSLYMLNLFAIRSTDPDFMLYRPDPIGPDNDDALRRYRRKVDLLVAAWGNHKMVKRHDRAKQVLAILEPVHCLEVLKDGFPKHPLYVPASRRAYSYYPEVDPCAPSAITPSNS